VFWLVTNGTDIPRA